jgi:hypothetical protein
LRRHLGFGNSGKRGTLGTPLAPLGFGRPSLAQPLETEMNGRRKRDGNGTASIIDSFFEVHKELGFGFREYIYTRALERLLMANAALCRPRGDASRGRPRPSFWQKRALLSRLLRKSVQAPKPAVPVVAVAVPFQSTVQLPFPKSGASMTGDGFRRSLTARCASECDAACDRNLSSWSQT